MRNWTVPPRILESAERVIRHPDPPVPNDPAACRALYNLLRPAAEELAELHPDIVVVASAPNRFNDVANYRWQLLRVGDTTIECDEYCDTRATYRAEIERDGRPVVRSAAAVLERLEAEHWRDVFVQAYDLPFHDEFIALVVQHELPWLVYATSNFGDREHAFGLWADEIRYFGECERTVEELIDERGLVFQRL